MNTFLAALVAYDKAKNSVVFAPGSVVGPVVTVVLAVVAVASVLFLISRLVGWLLETLFPTRDNEMTDADWEEYSKRK